MRKQNKFSPEVRERAVRMVQEHRGDYPSLWAAAGSIAPKIGCTQTTLLDWVKRAEIDRGVRPGVTTEERERIKTLEREVKELRRADLQGIADCPVRISALCRAKEESGVALRTR